MPRTNVFVSYSRADHEWRRRLMLHLAVLERSELIDVWSDDRLIVGSDWRAEIQSALSRARVAVLIVSPNFLASRFIWNEEMQPILEHAKVGMEVLPLIARPCAWRLEEALEKIEARPRLGRPLSTGTEAEIDLDLASFAYELAARLDPNVTALAIEEAERSMQTVRTTGSVRGPHLRIARRAASSAPIGAASLTKSSLWIGYYNTDLQMRVRIRSISGNAFTGTIEYPTDQVVTKMEGTFSTTWSANDPLWSQLQAAHTVNRKLALSFRETGYEKPGLRTISFDGEYRAFLIGDRMAGAWFSAGGRLVGYLEIRREAQAVTEKPSPRTRGLTPHRS